MDAGKRRLFRDLARRMRQHIMERRKTRAEAAACLKMTAEDLSDLGIIDKIIQEKDFDQTAKDIKNCFAIPQKTKGYERKRFA